MSISIEAKMDAIYDAFDEVRDEVPYLTIDVVRRLGRGVVSTVKRQYGTSFKKRTGAMYKGIRAVTDKTKLQTEVYSGAEDAKTGARYAFVLARGAMIEPQKKKCLTFQIDGKWYRTHGSKLPARDWINRPGYQYVMSEKADDDVEKVIQQTIAKLKKKGVLA